MAYTGSGNDIGSLRFLAANVVYQATGKMLNSEDEADRGVLDDAVLMMDVISSYYTEEDPDFAHEMDEIKKDRLKAESHLKPGLELDPSVLEGLRWRQLKAMFRSLCRKGTFVRIDPPVKEWVPNLEAR